MYGKRVEFFTTYNSLARDDIIKLTNSNFLLKKDNEELRICSFVTGAIVFYERNEKSEEVADVAIGLLSIYSLDEIIQKYM